jgi:tripartite motif-containing protein 71
VNQSDRNPEEVLSVFRMRRAAKPHLLAAIVILLLVPILSTAEPWEEYEFVLEWGSFGSDTAQFSRPRGMCADKYGFIYVCDQNNRRVQKFDSLGNFVMMFSSPDTSAPQDVAVDDSGYIYVTDPFDNRVQKFDSTGVFMFLWGNTGSGPGQFLEVRGISVDSSCYVYVADTENHRIQKFTSSGNFVAQWFSPDSSHWYPVSLATHGSSVYAYGSTNIQKFDPSGNFTLEWSNVGWAPEENAFPMDMASDTSGNVYIAEGWNDRCQKFDSNGKLMAVWGSGGTGPGLFDYPFGIAVGTDGCVYVGDTGSHKILKFRKLN